MSIHVPASQQAISMDKLLELRVAALAAASRIDNYKPEYILDAANDFLAWLLEDQ